jgi:HK97 gp10 family phage protein
MSVKGVSSLLSKLNRLGGNVEKALQTGINQSVKKIQADAKLLAPVGDNGQLRNSIQANVETRNGSPVGVVSTNLHYAPYVEFGTGQRGEASSAPPKWDGNLNYRQDWAGMPAQPFMFPAAQQNKGVIPEIVSRVVRKEIRKLGDM